MSEYNIEEIEMSIEHANKAIGLKECLDKLRNNKEFNTLVLEGYFEKEASRLVLLKADPQMVDKESQTIISKQIDAIGYLRQYFNVTLQLGRMAEKAKADDEATREALLAEEL